MQIIIDACAFSEVFKKEGNFFPIYDLVYTNRKAKIPIGGTKYKNEITKLLKFIIEFKKIRAVKDYPDDEVDQCQLEVLERYKKVTGKDVNSKFNDPHIIALQIISKAEIICSSDEEAFKYFKMKELYPKRHKIAKIYSNIKNKDLLKSR